MPSCIIDNSASGGQLIISGNFWSGKLLPVGGVNFVADPNNSGLIYIGFSGGLTVRSGNYPLSGGIYSGANDGCPVKPGNTYFVPAIAFGNRGGFNSGQPNMYAACDAAASGGFARLFFDTF